MFLLLQKTREGIGSSSSQGLPETAPLFISEKVAGVGPVLLTCGHTSVVSMLSWLQELPLFLALRLTAVTDFKAVEKGESCRRRHTGSSPQERAADWLFSLGRTAVPTQGSRGTGSRGAKA